MKKDTFPAQKVDRTRLVISALTDESDEKAYWLTRSPQERLAQIEFLRQINYGTQAAARLQRVLEITQR
jgi:hypothetical protein